MYRKLYRIVLISLLLLLLFPMNVFADTITLDGNFNDWESMPQLSDTVGDTNPVQDIVLAKWYPNVKEGKLYFYCERLASSEFDSEKKDNNGNEKKAEDWSFTTYLQGDGVRKMAYIYYHPESQKVDVNLYDETGRFLWSARGKWGEDKSIGKRVEFYIPLEYLTTSVVSGYQIETYFMSDYDRTPDSGNITISTVSTFPVQNTAALLIVSLTAFFILRKRFIKHSNRMKA